MKNSCDSRMRANLQEFQRFLYISKLFVVDKVFHDISSCVQHMFFLSLFLRKYFRFRLKMAQVSLLFYHHFLSFSLSIEFVNGNYDEEVLILELNLWHWLAYETNRLVTSRSYTNSRAYYYNSNCLQNWK